VYTFTKNGRDGTLTGGRAAYMSLRIIYRHPLVLLLLPITSYCRVFCSKIQSTSSFVTFSTYWYVVITYSFMFFFFKYCFYNNIICVFYALFFLCGTSNVFLEESPAPGSSVVECVQSAFSLIYQVPLSVVLNHWCL
jgi:hypothetical protein